MDELPERAEGLMHISGTYRSSYGATFVVLQNENGYEFLVPVDQLLSIFQTLWGSRYVKLRKHSYYGRAVYKLK